jgi:hypothetical protein
MHERAPRYMQHVAADVVDDTPGDDEDLLDVDADFDDEERDELDDDEGETE